MDKLVVIQDGDGYKAYPMKHLGKAGVAHDDVGGESIVIFHSRSGLSPVDHSDMSRSREAGSVGVFRTEVGDRSLSFRKEKEWIEDRETGSRWSLTGVAQEGELEGKRLEPVEHGVYFAFAWLAFQPDTHIVTLTGNR
jgi:hypothetical protein